MIYFLLDNNNYIWHILGYLSYEIFLIPILYLIQYIFWIFIAIITTNVGPKIFDIEISQNHIVNNFTNSPIFTIYISCYAISVLLFIFSLFFNLIKEYFNGKDFFKFKNNIQWFFITLFIFPLLPIFFFLILLITSIFFNIIGIKNYSNQYLNNSTLNNFDSNYNDLKYQILDIWNNINLNKEILSFINNKSNSNNFFYTNLIIELNNYENYIALNQDIFNKISTILSELKLNNSNTNLQNDLQTEINNLNNLNNDLISINYDLSQITNSPILKLNQILSPYKDYFSGKLINDLLVNFPYSLNNIMPYLGDTSELNIIYLIEKIANNNSKIINLTPNFYSLNWNVIIAIIFAIGLLILLFLYCLLEIRRIVELVVLFLVAPFCFVINSDDNNYFLSKWFKIVITKCFSLLIIAIIFQTSLTIYPYITASINGNLKNIIFSKLIVSCIVGIGILWSSFFSINSILSVFDARENLMEIISDLYGINMAKNFLFRNKLFRSNKIGSFSNIQDNAQQNNNYELTAEDIIFKKIPVPTTGFEKFMSSNKTHSVIKKINSATSKFILGSPGTKLSNLTNKIIENKLNKKFKKYRMQEQKWKKTRTEGEF